MPTEHPRPMTADTHASLRAAGGSGRLLTAYEVAELRHRPTRYLRALAELAVVMVAFGVGLMLIGAFR